MIVTMISKGQLANLKMVTVRPYLWTERNRFRANNLDTEKNSYVTFHIEFLK